MVSCQVVNTLTSTDILYGVMSGNLSSIFITSTDILYGVMSGNLSFIFTERSTHLQNILTNRTTSLSLWSWSWSYGSWIYNYQCNQCLSLLKLWIRIPLMARCTRCNIMWYSYQWFTAGRRFSPYTPVSSTNKTYLHGITEK